MASFKGDSNFRPYYDDELQWESASDEEQYTKVDPVRHRRNWVEYHYDVLMELYRAFRSSGEQVFGNVFFQLGDFERFVDFIYQNTHLDNNDYCYRQSSVLNKQPRIHCLS